MSTLPKGHRTRVTLHTERRGFPCSTLWMCSVSNELSVWLWKWSLVVSSSKLKIFVFNFKGSFWEQLVIFLPEEFNSCRKEGMGCASWRAFTAAGMSIKHCTASSSEGATKAVHQVSIHFYQEKGAPQGADWGYPPLPGTEHRDPQRYPCWKSIAQAKRRGLGKDGFHGCTLCRC